MKTNKQLLQVAISQLGNSGGKYRKFAGITSGPYCESFVYWLFNANGCGSLLPWKGTQRTYCPDGIKWADKNLALIPPYIALPCDLIYFDWEKNGRPNHVGIVEAKVSTGTIKTIEGNTSGKKNGKTVSGIVARKTRDTKYVQGVYRPHFAPSGLKRSKLKVDGEMGYKTVYMLQDVLKIKTDGILGKATVRALQKAAGASQDGAFGPATARKVQAMTGAKVDGQFGEASVRKLQEWINKKAYPTSAAKLTTPSKPTTTKATLKSRRIEVDLTNQICTVYGVYSDGSVKPIMSEFCSTARKGKTTPVGNFKISGASGGRKAKYRTAKMSGGKTYAEYLVRFKGAKCMHTVPYKKRQTTGHVNKSEFNKLGTPRSAGCVRLPWIMANYIYMTCPVGTPVKVFKGKAGAYPMGKPKKYTATTDIDPTYKK